MCFEIACTDIFCRVAAMAGETGATKAAWAAVTTAVAEERSWNNRKLPEASVLTTVVCVYSLH